MAEDMTIDAPIAVDDALLVPPSLEDQAKTISIPATTASDTDALPSSGTSPMAQSRVATVNILQELNRRAQSGDATSQFQLGYLYANGKGVRQDDQEAIHWYRQSALNGYPNGLIAMAEAFDLGRGVSRNAVAAYVLAKAAVAIKPEAAVVADQQKAKLSAEELTKAGALTVQDALKLK